MKKYIYILIVLLMIGCKPQEKIQERVITKMDSTALIKLQERINYQADVIGRLETSLAKVREEIFVLKSNSSLHDIKYDTNAQINPETGQYPKASETISTNNQSLERESKEIDNITTKFDKEIKSKLEIIKELESEVEVLTDENKKLKSQIKPQAGFNFKLVLISFLIGFAIPVIFSLRNKIKKILFLSV